MAQVKTVKEINAKEGKTGKPYWQIVWDDGKTDNIFDPLFHDKAKMAKENGWGLSITREENEKGYFNISELEFVKDVPPKDTPIPETGTNIPKPDTPKPPATIADISPQELGMWYKEIGEMARVGMIKENNPLMMTYWNRMFYALGIKAEVSPEAPQSTGKPIGEKADSKPPAEVPEVIEDFLAQEAVELGGAVIPSAKEIRAIVSEKQKKDPTLKIGVLGAMMDKLQSGAIKSSVKNTFGNATLEGVYQALTDENKIKFRKAL